MAEGTLYNKYRPNTFGQVCGQRSVLTVLKQQIQDGTFKNAYLFVGPAGTGKTTVARILAREINKGQGIPIEVNAASNNGVDDVRSIIENAKFKALDAEYRIYILDEVHMFSTGAWNAMLKTLEECPRGTIFIMCTTETQKIPATIMSRVQRFDFQRLPYETVLDRLRTIYRIENYKKCAAKMRKDGFVSDAEIEEELDKMDNMGEFDAPDGSLEYIAKLSDGGMRDAITMLDKCLSLDPELKVDSVVEALSAFSYETMIQLMLAIIEQRTIQAIEIIERVHYDGGDIKKFMRAFQAFVLDVYKFLVTGNENLLSIPKGYLHALDNFTDEDTKFVGYTLKQVNELNNAIKWDTQPLVLVESKVIQLCEE